MYDVEKNLCKIFNKSTNVEVDASYHNLSFSSKLNSILITDLYYTLLQISLFHRYVYTYVNILTNKKCVNIRKNIFFNYRNISSK